MFCKIDNGVKFLAGLTLGQSGQHGECYALPRIGPLLRRRPEVENRLLLDLEIVDKRTQNAFCFGQIGRGQERDVFIQAVTGGKAADGPKMFIEVHSQASNGLLRRFVAQACGDGIQLLQGKNGNGVRCPDPPLS